MKFGDELNISIKEYIGRIGPGITIILSVIYKSKVYEAMYWYTNTDNLLQFPLEIEEDLGYEIENHIEYDNIMNFLFKEKSNYKETASKLDDIFDEPIEDNKPPTD